MFVGDVSDAVKVNKLTQLVYCVLVYRSGSLLVTTLEATRRTGNQ